MKILTLAEMVAASQNRPNFDVDNVQFSYIWNNLTQRHIFILPGTNQLSDWFNVNLKLWRKNSYHAGFYEYALRVQRIIDWKFSGKKYFPHQILFTGHSLGAAVGNILCDLYDAEGVFFATPRFTSDKKRNLNVKNYRLKDDPIGIVPPKFLGYENVHDKSIGANRPGRKLKKHHISAYCQHFFTNPAFI